MTSKGNQQPARVREQFYTISLSRVRDLPEQEQPREVLERTGPSGLSDQQLLAVILRSGTKGLNVVDMAAGLLKQYGSLQALAQTSTADLAAVRGMGKVKAQVLQSAFELARRLSGPTPAAATVRTPEDAARLLRHEARVKEKESFWVLLLDTKYRLRRPPVEISQGILDASLVHPREVFKEAIRAACAAVVLVHNHPSGDPSPSTEDIRITRQLVEAGKIVDIEVLDHVILGTASEQRDKDHVSLRESGLVDFTV